jgi:hypothetical protein
LGFADIAAAQSPTAEQMRMINQLPPAQRQQALDAIGQAEARPAALTPLRETNEVLAADLSPVTPDVERPDPKSGAPRPFGYDLFESNEARETPCACNCSATLMASTNTMLRATAS